MMFDKFSFDDLELFVEDNGYGEPSFYCSYDKCKYKIVPFRMGTKHCRVDGWYIHGRFKIKEMREPDEEFFSISFNSKDFSFGHDIEYSGDKYSSSSLYKKRVEYLIFILKGILYFSYEDFIRIAKGEHSFIDDKRKIMTSMKTKEEFLIAVTLFESGLTYETNNVK